MKNRKKYQSRATVLGAVSNVLLKKIYFTRPLFCLFSFFSHDKYSTSLTVNDKSVDRDSNPGRQNGTRRLIHRSMVALMFFGLNATTSNDCKILFEKCQTFRSFPWPSWWPAWRPPPRPANCFSWCAGPKATRSRLLRTPSLSWWTWSKIGETRPTTAQSLSFQRKLTIWDQYYKTNFAMTQLMATCWCIIWTANWVQNSAYLHLLYRSH